MSNLVREFSFAAEDAETSRTIINNLADLTAAAAYREYGNHGIIGEAKLDNYFDMNDKVKTAMLGFAAEKAGIEMPKNSTDMAFAMDNTVFRNVMNTINVRALALVMVKYSAPQLDKLAEIENVGVGGSKTYDIETKALPIAQKATYGSNVSMVPSYAKGSVTVTPKPYTMGTSLDFIRIVANGYDYGAALARIYAGMLFAQYKLVVGKIFDTTVLNGTPLYQSTFAGSTFTQLADDVGMLNGGNADDVTALGTRVAWNAISALATTGGFTVKDEYIKQGYIGKVFGVNGMVLDQFTNLAAPFTSANVSSLRAIPNNLLVLVPATDKICKLVREDYIRVIETPANDNTLNRMEYTYFQNFDAALATASYFGLQGTTGA